MAHALRFLAFLTPEPCALSLYYAPQYWTQALAVDPVHGIVFTYYGPFSSRSYKWQNQRANETSEIIQLSPLGVTEQGPKISQIYHPASRTKTPPTCWLPISKHPLHKITLHKKHSACRPALLNAIQTLDRFWVPVFVPQLCQCVLQPHSPLKYSVSRHREFSSSPRGRTVPKLGELDRFLSASKGLNMEDRCPGALVSYEILQTRVVDSGQPT